MDTYCLDRRRLQLQRPDNMKRMLSAEQAATLRTLEQFGWSIRFVRVQAERLPKAAVYDPDKKVLAIIEADGRLVENPTLSFRS